jgi:hypothetical protein
MRLGIKMMRGIKEGTREKNLKELRKNKREGRRKDERRK